MDERSQQQVETNSFFVSAIGDLSDQELKSALRCQQVKVHSWEFAGEKRRFAEVFYHSISEAEQTYNNLNGIEIDENKLRFLVKRAVTSVWVSGLPSVMYARDLFITMHDLTPSLLRVSIPRNPEYPGLATLGICILTYDTYAHAEEAINILRNPSRLYNQPYRIFVGREIQAVIAEPFLDLKYALALETRILLLKNVSVFTSMRQIEEELSIFGQVERIRKYATSAVVTMRSVSEAKALLSSGELLVDGRRWKVKPAVRMMEDPSEPDLYKQSKQTAPKSLEPFYELSVLNLSTSDRQRLFEMIQLGAAFPCKKEAIVKGLSMDLLNKARRLLQHSRRPTDHLPSTDYLLTYDNKPVAPPQVAPYEPIKHPRYSEPPILYNYPSNAPAPMPKPEPRSLQPALSSSQQPLHPEMQNMTMEQKMQYYHYLNNPSGYYPPYNPYMP
jgi:hypothetical protein